MPRSTKSGAPSEASAHSLDTSPSLPEHLTRKTTNTFADGSRYGAGGGGGMRPIRPTASNVTAIPNNSKSKRNPSSGNSTDGGSTATDRSADYEGNPSNPGVGIGGWVSGIRVPSSNNLHGALAAEASVKSNKGGLLKKSSVGGSTSGPSSFYFGGENNNHNNNNTTSALKREGSGRTLPNPYNNQHQHASHGGGSVGFSGIPNHQYQTNSSSNPPTNMRIGIQNPDPNSYELPKKEYVRYQGDGRSSKSSQSSDGDRYHFRNSNKKSSAAEIDFMLSGGDDMGSDGITGGAGGASVHSRDGGGTTNGGDTSYGGTTVDGGNVTNGDSVSSSEDDSLETGSASSMSSNARRSKEIAERPMMSYMIALIAVPIFLLALYAGLTVATAESARRYMSNHEHVVSRMLSLQRDVQDEMLVVSELIGLRRAYNISGEVAVPSWAPDIIRNETTRANAFFHDTIISLDEVLRESIRGDGEIAAFYQQQLDLPELIGFAQIAANRNQGKLYRTYMSSVLTELSSLLGLLAADEHSVLFRMELVDMTMLVRVEEQWTLLFAMYRELEFATNKTSQQLANVSSAAAEELKNEHREQCIDFSASFSEMEGFIEYLKIGGGSQEIRDLMEYFSSTGMKYLRSAYEPYLSCDFSNATWFDPDEMLRNYDSERERNVALQFLTFDRVVNNKLVKSTSLTEGMKLMVAIVCCVVGLAVMIVIQKRERTELLQVIEHSERLALACKKFVPKNALRSMGVKTLLQAEPGFATEVAQSLVFSEVRNFAQLADTMSRIELFDWLQMLVSRLGFVVQAQRGYIDAVLGDSQFSVFPQATYAVGATIMIQQEVDHMNIDLVAQKQGNNLVRVGVGCHTGLVACGVFGNRDRLSCTMVSSSVNLASRLQGLTKVYGTRIILSRAVMEQIDAERFEIRRLAVVSTAGSSNSLEIFDLFQADPELVKLFKLATIKEFEKAVAYSASEVMTEREKALKILRKLEAQAQEMNVFDPCIPIKISEALREDTKSFTKVTKEIVAQAELGGNIKF